MKTLTGRLADFEYERSILMRQPRAIIVGVDEAGRGPLAGPVSVGYVVWPSDFFACRLPTDLHGLDDSKKLSHEKRLLLALAIKKHSQLSGVVHRSNRRIDELNINGAIAEAVLLLIRRILAVGLQVDHILIDGNYRFKDLYACYPEIQFSSIIKGDQRVWSIASASILAKSSRDLRMLKYDRIFPAYQLARHKGYGTQKHRELIALNGPCQIHRRSFKW